MRLTILKDKRITKDEMAELERQFVDLYYEATSITPIFFVEEHDFADYPTYRDSAGYDRPTDGWMRGLAKDVSRRYSGEGTDHVVLLVHEDNWKSDPPGKGGIWGTNYSNVYSGYQLQYCRFDRDNMANSLGTLYHEVHHSHDALIKTYLGIDIAPMVGVRDWDHEVTHGNNPNYSYIRHKDNLDALKTIGSLLQAAYQKRLAIYEQKVRVMKRQVSVLEQLLVLMRQLFIKKRSNPTT